jgi:26S proteasome regulatory subunit T4
VRLEIAERNKYLDKTEEHLKAQQSVGQIVGEVLQMLDPEKFIVKASMGPRYVVGVRSKIDRDKLKPGTRVTLGKLCKDDIFENIKC